VTAELKYRGQRLDIEPMLIEGFSKWVTYFLISKLWVKQYNTSIHGSARACARYWVTMIRRTNYDPYIHVFIVKRRQVLSS
jgi:hypothetical protein